MASHGLTVLGPPAGDVTDDKGLNQDIGGGVSLTLTSLFVPADWTLDAKCDGGTRSAWTFPTERKKN